MRAGLLIQRLSNVLSSKFEAHYKNYRNAKLHYHMSMQINETNRSADTASDDVADLFELFESAVTPVISENVPALV